jgi:basic amino acid/polyamine antiporter, APA family
MTGPNSSPVDSLPPVVSLHRALGLGMAVAVVIGNTIGAGIFVKPGRIAADAGSFPLILSMWLLGTVLCIFGGLCLAELSSMHPQAGGLYVYLREAYGRLAAFLFGWQEFLFARPASTGALAVVAVDSIAHAAGLSMPTWLSVVSAITVVAMLASINIVGVMWGARVQAITTVVKCAMVVAIAIAPLLLQWLGRDTIHWEYFSQTTPPEKTTLATRAAAVLLAVMWAFNGWEGVVPIAEEVRNPGKNLPRALLAGIGLLGLLYISATLAYHAVIPISEMVQPPNREHVAELLVARLMGPWGGSLMSIGIVLSTLGTINSNLLTSSRVTFAMGRDQLLPDAFGRLHSRFRTPVAAIAFQAAMAAVLVVASALLIQTTPYFQSRSIFDLLTDCIVFAASLFYTAAVAAVLRLRYLQPNHPRPFRTPWYPWIPILYLLTYAWFIVSIFQGQPIEALFGLALIGLGIPYFFWKHRRSP